ncbi:hypothetical protein ACK1CN_21870 [Vibrio coralliilyticus]|uniref:Uncharacterized protein n=2 Tax=Vibrio TaxID=662 RepID=A0A2A2MR69_9VIBR|nr:MULTISPECIES: hypothetical protein [Vibrio]QXL80260.1 hypothetical protein [Vibrio sp.]ERB63359.1 hypothetical protein N779_21160 [Vibrio coralliilyticus OCN008]NOI77472.1 hypothetical protein [Vibrio coralliilyticus]NOJ24240.1 hypothetical protein [Vibrio coralliilyticus]NRF16269.1 hypothetical protein [Vibrio coralliilyticus]
MRMESIYEAVNTRCAYPISQVLIHPEYHQRPKQRSIRLQSELELRRFIGQSSPVERCLSPTDTVMLLHGFTLILCARWGKKWLQLDNSSDVLDRFKMIACHCVGTMQLPRRDTRSVSMTIGVERCLTAKQSTQLACFANFHDQLDAHIQIELEI